MSFPIAREGWAFIGPAAAVAVLGLALRGYGRGWVVLGAAAAVLAAAFTWFFRDPDRTVSTAPGLILSPGDGRVMEVSEVDEPDFLRGRGTVIKIFLAVWNIHVQRAPAAGAVRFVSYRPGKFLPAMAAAASAENERNLVGLEVADRRGRPVKMLVTQVAGILARRISCWTREGASLERGQRYGLIKFGSQVDLFLPAGVSVRVKPGDHVRGGETVLAEFPG